MADSPPQVPSPQDSSPEASSPEASSPEASSPLAPSRRPRRGLRLFLTVVSVSIAALWVYTLFFASKQAVGRLDDRAWAERAEEICTVANVRRGELVDTRRIADAGPDALTERAAIIDRATDIVEKMLDDVVAVTPTGPDDAALLARWEAFYRDLIDYRRVYTDVLRTGSNEQFREAAEGGAPISEWINDFAVINEITACAAPLDLSI
jgi:hypothetical protein